MRASPREEMIEERERERERGVLALEKQLDVERDKAIAREWRGRERSILPRPLEI